MVDDFLKFQHLVDQRATALTKDMVKELLAVREKVLGKLAALQDEILNGTEFDDASITRKKRLLTRQKEEIEKILDEVYAEISSQLQDAGEDVLQATAKATTRTMNKALGLKVASYRLEKKLIEEWFKTSTVEGLLINDWMTKLEANTVDRIVSVGRQSLIEGLSTQQTARLMRQKGIEGSIPGTEGLARTFLHSASHFAKETVIEDEFEDVVEGWRYLAVLDRRTCVACAKYDRRIYKLGERKPRLPRHWMCRCVYVPKTRKIEGFPDLSSGSRPSVKHSMRKVRHRDGSTSTEFKVQDVEQFTGTYNQWLKYQLETDPEFVRSILGKTRFELFKSGKLSLDAMSTDGVIKRLSEHGPHI